jgi:hypothetical protein
MPLPQDKRYYYIAVSENSIIMSARPTIANACPPADTGPAIRADSISPPKRLIALDSRLVLRFREAASCFRHLKEIGMASVDEQILRTTKEIVVKFIETGRVSPAGFPEVFQSIYRTIADTVQPPPPDDPAESDAQD